jgi:hypothetical protein
MMSRSLASDVDSTTTIGTTITSANPPSTSALIAW